MGKIFCLMGKSGSGKDTIYSRLLEDADLDLSRIIPYTTRPVRAGETEGREYHFITPEELKEYRSGGRVIEERCYHTVHGDWYYATIDDGSLDLAHRNYLMIGTPEAYLNMRDYFSEGTLVPVYIEVEDGLRLTRALERERSQQEPKYREMCRRFLADSEDFSEERLEEAGIGRRFVNNDLDTCLREIKEYLN